MLDTHTLITSNEAALLHTRCESTVARYSLAQQPCRTIAVHAANRKPRRKYSLKHSIMLRYRNAGARALAANGPRKAACHRAGPRRHAVQQCWCCHRCDRGSAGGVRWHHHHCDGTRQGPAAGIAATCGNAAPCGCVGLLRRRRRLRRRRLRRARLRARRCWFCCRLPSVITAACRASRSARRSTPPTASPSRSDTSTPSTLQSHLFEIKCSGAARLDDFFATVAAAERVNWVRCIGVRGERRLR